MPPRTWKRNLIFLGSTLASLMLAGCGPSARLRTISGDCVRPPLHAVLTTRQFLALSDDQQSLRRQQSARCEECANQLEVQQDNFHVWRYDPPMINLLSVRHAWYSVDNAVADLRLAVVWDPSDAATATRLGQLESLVGEQVAARVHLTSAWAALDAGQEPRLSSRRRSVAVAMAWSYRDEGLWEQARTWMERALTAAPHDPEARVLEGLVLAGEGRIDEAFHAAASLGAVGYQELSWTLRSPIATPAPRTRTRASGTPANWIRAMAHLHDGRSDLAWHALQPVRWEQLLLPMASRYWQDVGLVAELGDRPEASRAYTLARATSPYFTGLRLHARRGPTTVLGQPRPTNPCFLSDRGGFIAGSLFAYASMACTAYLSDPEGTDAPRWLERSRGLLSACINRGIWTDHARALRGRIEFVAQDRDDGETDLLAASSAFARSGRTDATTEMLLGRARLSVGDYTGARARLEAATAADPLLRAAWSDLGTVQAAMGDTPAARLSMDRALELEPGNGLTWFNRGLLRACNGDLDGGREDLEQAARLTPYSASTIALLQQIRYAKRQGMTSLPAPDPLTDSDSPPASTFGF